MRVSIILISLLVCLNSCTQQQTPAFWKEIQEFKKQDKLNPPQPGQILFTGSSSFALWKDIKEYFPGYQILNRGFGGSSLPDVIRYANEIIFPYQPKQIVLYVGENDFAASDTVSVPTVVNRFKELFHLIRSKDADVAVAYVSMKPSPSRKHLLEKFAAANKEIENFLRTEENTVFINVYDKMLEPSGNPLDDIFLEDQLHMNAKGYALWKKEIEPNLMK